MKAMRLPRLRHQAVPDLPTAIRLRLYLADADQPVWPGDRYDARCGHVVAALIMKIHAQIGGSSAVELWGTGTPRREFCSQAIWEMLACLP